MLRPPPVLSAVYHPVRIDPRFVPNC